MTFQEILFIFYFYQLKKYLLKFPIAITLLRFNIKAEYPGNYCTHPVL